MKKFAVLMLVVFMVVAVYGSSYAEEKAKQEAAPQPAAGFSIARMVVGTGVENKEPVGVAETFPATTEKVYCFLEASNIAADTNVSFVWYHGQQEMRKIDLSLKQGSRWRTYAHKNITGLKGDWSVEIKDANGNSVKTVKFKIE